MINLIQFFILICKRDPKYQNENDVIASIKNFEVSERIVLFRIAELLYPKRIQQSLKLELFFYLKGEFVIVKFGAKSWSTKC